ncbi:hypothetical protein [Knoellia koreensis]|jgi:hypothetical protein|uniref:Uncharacterized protein n=1 Tax=Knoellia koreensis TaxID=2730921 RepID=A0A849HJY8_9MICO|nr:hypothetical protein [Knoellia sp. DB2414S]NNM47738.1 hypothetical protein [Knoellia sp. DB2414S]
MPETTPTTHATDGAAILTRVAAELEATARKLWARAEAEGPLCATYTFAQDLHLTADYAAGLIPPEAEHQPQVEPVAAAGDLLTVVTEAESLLRSVPIEALPPGSSQLVVRLADLARQARG